MTDPFSIALLALTVGLGAAAGWLSSPSAPELDGERLFKLALASVWMGKIDGDNGTAADWEEACRRWVPYHPAGRQPEDKLTRPGAYRPPGHALDGEIALLQQLERLSDVPSRARFLYQEAELGLEARMVDPAELGEDWDLARWIAPEATWEALAGWSASDRRFVDALARQLDARWVVTPGALGQVFADELGATEVAAEALVAFVESELTDRQGRLVLVTEGEDGLALLDVLRTQPGLRDRVLAVVAIGVPLWGRQGGEGELSEGARRDWMDAYFRHEVLDTESMRLTPYCAVQWLDLDAEEPGADGIGLGHARFGVPKGLEEALRIESVDLGPVPVGHDLRLLARAIAAAVGVLVLSKR